MSKEHTPFLELGEKLKLIREQSKLSIEEVSGAIEMNTDNYVMIEAGKIKPDEDLMMLLITFINPPEQDAMSLWSLAQYDRPFTDYFYADEEEDMLQDIDNEVVHKSLIMVMPVDLKTIYSDRTSVDFNENGYTVNFFQTPPSVMGMDKMQMPVSRVGMSESQVLELISQLKYSLMKSKFSKYQKMLPKNVPNDKSTSSDKKPNNKQKD